MILELSEEREAASRRKFLFLRISLEASLSCDSAASCESIGFKNKPSKVIGFMINIV